MQDLAFCYLNYFTLCQTNIGSAQLKVRSTLMFRNYSKYKVKPKTNAVIVVSTNHYSTMAQRMSTHWCVSATESSSQNGQLLFGDNSNIFNNL